MERVFDFQNIQFDAGFSQYISDFIYKSLPSLERKALCLFMVLLFRGNFRKNTEINETMKRKARSLEEEIFYIVQGVKSPEFNFEKKRHQIGKLYPPVEFKAIEIANSISLSKFYRNMYIFCMTLAFGFILRENEQSLRGILLQFYVSMEKYMDQFQYSNPEIFYQKWDQKICKANELYEIFWRNFQQEKLILSIFNKPFFEEENIWG